MTDGQDHDGSPRGAPPGPWEAGAYHLSGLLARAAGDGEPVGFDPDDVRRRAHRRARQRRGLALASILAVVAVAAGVVALAARGDDDEGVYVEEGQDVELLTTEGLTAAPWVATAFSTVTVGADGPIVPFLTFRPDGQLWAHDGCQMAEGSWRLDAGRLDLDVALDDWRGEPCGDRTGLQAVLAGPPRAGPPDGEGLGSLEVRTGGDFVAFERFDRQGTVPGPDDLVGTWADTSDDDSASTFAFAADGTLRAGAGTCEVVRSWTVEDGRLSVRDDRGDPTDEESCGVLPPIGHDVLDGTSPVRLAACCPGGGYLWIDAGGVVITLQRPGTEPAGDPTGDPVVTGPDEGGPDEGAPAATTRPARPPGGAATTVP